MQSAEYSNATFRPLVSDIFLRETEQEQKPLQRKAGRNIQRAIEEVQEEKNRRDQIVQKIVIILWKSEPNPLLCRLTFVSFAKAVKHCTYDRDSMNESKHTVTVYDMTSNDLVLQEETSVPNHRQTKHTVQQRTNVLKEMAKSFPFEMVEPDENENVFVWISEACKSEASRQSNLLMEVAEGLCSENSPTLQRKGKVFKKLAPEVEKHVFNEMQQDLCQNMWKEAREHVYGTPCYNESFANFKERNATKNL